MPKPKKVTIETKTVKLKSITLNPANPRTITEKEMENLTKSLQEFPEMMELREIVIDENNMILGGNMRFRSLEQSGDEFCIAKIVKGLTDEQKREFVIKDNGSWGAWNYDALANGWDDLPLAEWGVGLPEAWSQAELDIKDADDEVPEVPEDPTTKTGDLYILGDHRLLCGDATKREDVERLMDGKKADMVFTDPPYGVEIVSTDKTQATAESNRPFGFVGADGIVSVNAYSPIKGDDTINTAKAHYELCIDIKFEKFVLWGGNYFTGFLPPSPCWIVWDKREDIPSNNFADCEIAWTSFNSPSRVYHHLWSGLLRKGNRKDELVGRVHPTQKPVTLFVNILNDLKCGDVFDGFGGSGSTLIACEKTNRKCYMMEIDPYYCDVIVKRWENYTEKKAKKEKT